MAGRPKRKLQIKSEIPDPDITEQQHLPANNEWRISEDLELVKLVMSQFVGVSYKAYKDGIHDVDWSRVHIDHRTTSACIARLTHITKSVKKYRTLAEILADYANVFLKEENDTELVAEVETIENVSKKSKRAAPKKQTKRPVEVETTESVPKTSKQTTQKKQTSKVVEVVTAEHSGKRNRRGNQINGSQYATQGQHSYQTNSVGQYSVPVQYGNQNHCTQYGAPAQRGNQTNSTQYEAPEQHGYQTNSAAPVQHSYQPSGAKQCVRPENNEKVGKTSKTKRNEKQNPGNKKKMVGAYGFFEDEIIDVD